LQCVAECCSVLLYVAVCCSVLQSVAVCCCMLQCAIVATTRKHTTNHPIQNPVLPHSREKKIQKRLRLGKKDYKVLTNKMMNNNRKRRKKKKTRSE